MTKAQWQRFAAQWEKTGKALEHIKRKELENMIYKPADADTLLDIGSRFAFPRRTNGMVIMQRYFMKWWKKQEQFKTSKTK